MNLIRDKWMLFVAAGLLAVLIWAAAYHPYRGPDTIDPPEQINLMPTESIMVEGRSGPIKLELLAEYRITAAVKSRKNYQTDAASRISPTDLVLAWGTLNQPKIDQHIRYRQSGRWYYFQYDSDCPVSQSYIQQHSANVHIIPADRTTSAAVKRLRKNDTVSLEGYLVSALLDQGSWTSSLTRQDSGSGSCEILYVTRVTIHNGFLGTDNQSMLKSALSENEVVRCYGSFNDLSEKPNGLMR